MKERALRFGPDETLVGVLTEPSPDKLRPGAPAIIVSNVGINHHVGPHRIWVELARALAEDGFTTLRFDVSGLGDSEPSSGTRTDLERAVADTREAMAWLTRKKQVQRFVLAGLCSGTDSVYSLARDDSRVTGAAFIDGYSFPTLTSRLRFKLRYLSPLRWKRLLRRTSLQLQQAAPAEEIYVREYPTPTKMAADLAVMLERRARLLFVYAGAEGYTHLYAEQFHDMLQPADFRGRIELEFYERADHLFSLPTDRAVLIDRLRRFVLDTVRTEAPTEAPSLDVQRASLPE